MTARCPHFGSCGGCSIQNLPYEDQLKKKTSRVAAALASADLAPALTTHPSPDIWFYRNKMEFGFGDVYPALPPGEPTLRLGLKPRGRWYEVLDLAECSLLSPEAGPLLAAVRDWAEKNSVLPYNSHKHTGLLRNLVVRESKNGPERMILLVTAPGEIPKDSFMEAVQKIYPATTILRGINATKSDTAFCGSLETWTGSGTITETLHFKDASFRFRISPQSFFQTNTKGAQVLYGLLRSWVRDLGAKTVLDLYCGAGGIGISMADPGRSIVGVEQNPAAVEDAKNNAALNGLSGVEFIAGSAEVLAAELLAKDPDAVIVDPPRAGLHPRALKSLVELAPPSLLYVSCNPEALGRDLGVLKADYRIERAAVVDLFPHTEHVETAVWLTRAA